MLGRVLFWLVVLLNLGGAAYGLLFFYAGQFASTTPLLWVFIPDCPLAALLFAAAFFFRGEGRPRPLRGVLMRALGRVPDLSWVWFLAFVMAMKYGFWTVFALLAYPGFYFTPESGMLFSVLFAGHMFLFFETLLLVGRIRVREWHLLPALGFLFINDLSDYLLGTHPPLPGSSLGFMLPATMAMTAVFSLIGYLILTRHSREYRM